MSHTVASYKQRKASRMLFERYELKELLGRGASGDVYRAYDRKRARFVALKRIQLANNAWEAVLEELLVLKQIRHPDLVRLHNYHLDSVHDEVLLDMELCEMGSVADVLHMCDAHIYEPEIRALARATLRALVFLHAQKVVHRDIKAGNVFLQATGRVKLGDLGTAVQLTESMPRRNDVKGSIFWMAPEVVQRSAYGAEADIWSFGITLIEFAEREPPLFHVHPFRALFLIPQGPPPSLSAPQGWSDEFVDLVSCCLHMDPSERKSAAELLQHPFLAHDEDDEERILCGFVERYRAAMEIARQLLTDELIQEQVEKSAMQESRTNQARNPDGRADHVGLGNNFSGKAGGGPSEIRASSADAESACDPESDSCSNSSVVIVQDAPEQLNTTFQNYIKDMKPERNIPCRSRAGQSECIQPEQIADITALVERRLCALDLEPYLTMGDTGRARDVVDNAAAEVCELVRACCSNWLDQRLNRLAAD
ncbi:Serine/threonine-protein kinase 3 [Porphyridium purpureum]|uniref:non-specific serine/threonine protein kinase n=1 Tax=Porphyridium purpureum TaxID=35688 RepID=A0A5J4YW26_PORPP|nr:Serine/threonine-protein kinase 3 [Porphyridium purpureum]|eukprot:POR3245..scf209_3